VLLLPLSDHLMEGLLATDKICAGLVQGVAVDIGVFLFKVQCGTDAAGARATMALVHAMRL